MSDFVDPIITQEIVDAKDKLVDEANRANAIVDDWYATGNLVKDAPQDGSTYARKDAEWVLSGDDAQAEWGSVVGDIDDQADLKARLDGKQPLRQVLTDTTASFTVADEIKLGYAITDAPTDTKQYARQDGAWTEVIGGGTGGDVQWGEILGTLSDQVDLKIALDAKLGEAPYTGQIYGRVNEEWAVIATLPEAPADGKIYGRGFGTWVEVGDGTAQWGDITGTLHNQVDLQDALDAKLEEAPNDGQEYVRRNESWSPLTTSIGDMEKSVYDTTNKNSDAFYRPNFFGQDQISDVNNLQSELDNRCGADVTMRFAQAGPSSGMNLTFDALNVDIETQLPNAWFGGNGLMSQADKNKLDAYPVDPVGEAPINGTLYGRKDGGWEEVTGGTGGLEEAPNDGNKYVRQSEAWALESLSEAPIDGQQYTRQDGAWALNAGGDNEFDVDRDVSTSIKGTEFDDEVFFNALPSGVYYINALSGNQGSFPYSGQYIAYIHKDPNSVTSPSSASVLVHTAGSFSQHERGEWNPLWTGTDWSWKMNDAIVEAPIDGNEYVRKSGGWYLPSGEVYTTTEQTKLANIEENAQANKFDYNDAPSDTKQYARKDGAWEEVVSGGGGGAPQTSINAVGGQHVDSTGSLSSTVSQSTLLITGLSSPASLMTFWNNAFGTSPTVNNLTLTELTTSSSALSNLPSGWSSADGMELTIVAKLDYTYGHDFYLTIHTRSLNSLRSGKSFSRRMRYDGVDSGWLSNA